MEQVYYENGDLSIPVDLLAGHDSIGKLLAPQCTVHLLEEQLAVPRR